MKKQLFALSSLCLIFSACEHAGHPGSSNQAKQDATHPSAYSAQDTGRNIRDRGDQALTPGNQGENEVDRTITQKIRQAVVEDDSLSTNAKNIKIITINSVVTLRGPVNSDREKNEIAKKAKAVSGIRAIDNQLEVIRDNSNANSASGAHENIEVNR